MILIFGQFLTNMSQFLFLGCCESSSHLNSGGTMFIDVFIWMMVMVMVSLKVANSGKDQILDLEPEDQGSKRRARFCDSTHPTSHFIVKRKPQVLSGLEAEAVSSTGVKAQQMSPKKVSFQVYMFRCFDSNCKREDGEDWRR